MSSCNDRREPRGGVGEGAESRGGANHFFNGIFKGGFKLEVIGVFMFVRRKSEGCVSVCDFINVHACPRMRGLAAITASCKRLSQPPFRGSVYQLDK